MKIKITTSCAGVNFSYSAGEVVEVDTIRAKDLITAGFAEEVKEVKSVGKKDVKPKTETEVKSNADS